jgi:hypothetical protein
MPFPDAKYPPARQPEERILPHTILVAFCVQGTSFHDAQRRLMGRLPDPAADGHKTIDSWWIAEDDRVDGSDNESAVFVSYGTQRHCINVLDKDAY